MGHSNFQGSLTGGQLSQGDQEVATDIGRWLEKFIDLQVKRKKSFERKE